MINPTRMMFSTAVVAALDACAAMAPTPAAATPSCKTAENYVVTGTYPVYSFWCEPTTPGHPGKIQLDVYVYNDRNGPLYYNCSTPPLPAVVSEVFCSP
jgi:hypothetical protein